MSILRKYKRHKIDIKNSIYNRYILTNRGNTPISFKTRYLNFSFDEYKRLTFLKTIYSRRTARIYRINKKDFKFDFSSCKVSSSIIEISKSLDPSGVCVVYILNDYNGVFYINPFENNNGEGYKVEQTVHRFLPGVYYSRGLWMWTDKLSITLNGLVGRTYRNNYYSTDYTQLEDMVIPYANLADMQYAIYIPFDCIKTTVLQAYLPLSRNISFIFNGRAYDDSHTYYGIVDLVNSDIIWMGRGIRTLVYQDFEIKETGTIENLHPSNGMNYRNIVNDAIYYNMIPIDAGFHHLCRVGQV